MAATPNIPPEYQEKVTQLNRAIFSRENKSAARLYTELSRDIKGFVLRPAVQFDLGRLLELGGDLELAYTAFETLVRAHGDSEFVVPSYRHAGHIAWRIRKYDQCQDYLRRFLATNPPPNERNDAEELLSRLPPAGGTPPPRKPPEAIPKSSSSGEQSKPVVYEWSMPRKGSRGSRGPGSDSRPPSVRVDGQPSPVPDSAPKPVPKSSPSPVPPTEKSGSVIRIEGLNTPVQTPPPPSPEPKPVSRVLPLPPVADFAAPPPPVSAPSAPVKNPDSATVDLNKPPAGAAGFDRPAPRKPAEFESPPAPLPASIRDRVSDPPTDKQHLLQPPVSRPAAPSGDGFPRDDFRERAPSPEDSRPPFDIQSEPPEVRYYRLRATQFALILPFGKRIHLDAVAELVARVEEIDEATAKKKVISRKGIVFDRLTLQDVVELYPLTAECRQALTFVHIDRSLRPVERQDCLGAELLPPGIKLTTERGVRRARWNELRLVSAGTLNGHSCVDLFTGAPTRHYRMQLGMFNIATAVDIGRSDPNRGLIELLNRIAEYAPTATRSHTVENFRSGATPKPQAFADEREYADYNAWLLFSHFAEAVDAKELSEQYRVASNW